MVTRENRLRDFNTGVAPEGMRADQKQAGTYLPEAGAANLALCAEQNWGLLFFKKRPPATRPAPGTIISFSTDAAVDCTGDHFRSSAGRCSRPVSLRLAGLFGFLLARGGRLFSVGDRALTHGSLVFRVTRVARTRRCIRREASGPQRHFVRRVLGEPGVYGTAPLKKKGHKAGRDEWDFVF
jgi:hypothetical protein